ncbi:hypothetical protein FC36_GL001865 [Ligilactobacillus equi DSM 15833 = JCM 10991]|uniref:Uncharacterized protein n=2 Tax=Ligilactobacillus equi TaxID=137357 RepID=A0A0R1TD84_9LACO|nr:hypothetical protein FC36_GL001865 [Ligilactobacillus equi DSM 15833 = JCM 10991]
MDYIKGGGKVMAELSEARKRANKKWDEKNKEKKKLYTYRSTARSFVKNLASEQDLLELRQLIDDTLKQKSRD